MTLNTYRCDQSWVFPEKSPVRSSQLDSAFRDLKTRLRKIEADLYQAGEMIPEESVIYSQHLIPAVSTAGKERDVGHRTERRAHCRQKKKRKCVMWKKPSHIWLGLFQIYQFASP